MCYPYPSSPVGRQGRRDILRSSSALQTPTKSLPPVLSLDSHGANFCQVLDVGCTSPTKVPRLILVTNFWTLFEYICRQSSRGLDSNDVRENTMTAFAGKEGFWKSTPDCYGVLGQAQCLCEAGCPCSSPCAPALPCHPRSRKSEFFQCWLEAMSNGQIKDLPTQGERIQEVE